MVEHIVRTVTITLRICSMFLSALSFYFYVYTDLTFELGAPSNILNSYLHADSPDNGPVPFSGASDEGGVVSFTVRLAYTVSVLGTFCVSVILMINHVGRGHHMKKMDAMFHMIGCIVLFIFSLTFLSLMGGDKPIGANYVEQDERIKAIWTRYSYWFFLRILSGSCAFLSSILYGVIALFLVLFYGNMNMHIDMHDIKSKFSMKQVHPHSVAPTETEE